jgi:putative transposase
MVIRKTFKFRLYPNAAQQELLARHFGCVRVVYNHFLRQRIDFYAAHKGEEKQGLTYTDTTRLLTQLKRQPEYAWLGEVNSQALQQALKNLDAAYANFFEGRAGFPQFKRKRAKQSFRVPQSFALDEKTGHLRLPKMTPIKIVVHRPLEGTLRSVTVSRSPSGRYFASLLCELEVPERPPKERGTETGVDLGLKSFAVTSDGRKIDTPSYLRKAETKLARLQRLFARKKPDSHNREKARSKVARLHEKIANQRADFLHQQSWRLVRDNQALYVESLNVIGLLANHSLAKSISDAGWGEFLRQLKYKGGWYGCQVEAVDRFFPSSQLCHRCGYRYTGLTLSDREWDCPGCHAHLDRDVNAARNLLAEGQARTQHSVSGRAGTAPTLTPGETCARKVGRGTRKLAASAVEPFTR